jgi:hypothetical protein
MMGTRAELKGGSEYDAFYARKIYCYLQRSGTVKKIKRAFWKRQRIEQRMELRGECHE